MHRIFSRFRGRVKERKGQGLVEYALILVLVAIVVIAIVTLFGRTISDTYCGIVFAMGQHGSGSAKMCKNPIVTCNVVSRTGNQLNLEAVVIDPDLPSSMTLTQSIRVEFYRNGTHQSSWYQETEKFCIGGGGDPPATACTTTRTVASGDTIRAVATDADGNTGECTYRVP